MEQENTRGMLERGLSVLENVAKAQPGTSTVASISKETGLPKSTVYRLVAIERERGYLDYDSKTRTLSLGLKFFELAALHSSARDLFQIAHSRMDSLSDATGETIQLSVLNDGSALFIGKVSSPHAVTIRGDIGHRGPLYATSTGKVLLAYQPTEKQKEIIDGLSLRPWTPNTILSREALEREVELVRSQHYALANEEYDPGVIAIAAPIFNANSVLKAALCISAPKYRTTQDRLIEWLPLLQESARQIGLMIL